MLFKTMAFVAAVSIALPAIAQTGDTAPPTPAPIPKKERKLCRAVAGATGSNMAQSVCHTKSEWAMIDDNGLDPTANIRGRSSTESGNLGPGVH